MTVVNRYGATSAVAVDKLDASLIVNSAQYSAKLTTAETTHFQSANLAKEFIVGVAEGTMTLSGMYDALNTVTFPTLVSYDAYLETLGTQSNTFPVTMAFDGGFAAGRRVMMANCFGAGYTPTSPIGGVVNVKCDLTVTGRPLDGYSYTSYAPITTATTTNFASVDGGAVLSTAGGQFFIHVTGNTWTGTTTVKMQSSADNAVWADLAGTTQVVPASTQIAYALSASGTIPRYLRAVVTTAAGSGAVSVLAAFARN